MKAHHETEVQYLFNGWSYRKNSDAGEFVLTYQLIYKNFRLAGQKTGPQANRKILWVNEPVGQNKFTSIIFFDMTT